MIYTGTCDGVRGGGVRTELRAPAETADGDWTSIRTRAQLKFTPSSSA